MSNDELPDPDEGWRLKTYGLGVPIRIGRVLLGGPHDGKSITCAPHFAQVYMPDDQPVPWGEEPKRHLYVRREFIRDPEISGLPYKQVAVFWCCPGTDDDKLEGLAAERWP